MWDLSLYLSIYISVCIYMPIRCVKTASGTCGPPCWSHARVRWLQCGMYTSEPIPHHGVVHNCIYIIFPKERYIYFFLYIACGLPRPKP